MGCTGADRRWDCFVAQIQDLCVLADHERPTCDVGPCFFVPEDVVVDHLSDLLDGDAFPVPKIEQFVLEATEEALARHVVSQSGQR